MALRVTELTFPINISDGLNAYEAGEVFAGLGCPKDLISNLSRVMVSFWDLFISCGMESAEVNPWRITPEGKPYACDFKAVINESNYKAKVTGVVFPEYPENISAFEEEMAEWSGSSHQGQTHISSLGGTKILPILFGGGVSTIISETLESTGGSPIILSDFGGNPPMNGCWALPGYAFLIILPGLSCFLFSGARAIIPL